MRNYKILGSTEIEGKKLFDVRMKNSEDIPNIGEICLFEGNPFEILEIRMMTRDQLTVEVREMVPCSCRADEQMSCKLCRVVLGYDFSVPDVFWEEVVPEAYQGHVLCAGCFHTFALAKGTASWIEDRHDL